jgi:hypothetical protein
LAERFGTVDFLYPDNVRFGGRSYLSLQFVPGAAQ